MDNYVCRMYQYPRHILPSTQLCSYWLSHRPVHQTDTVIHCVCTQGEYWSAGHWQTVHRWTVYCVGQVRGFGTSGRINRVCFRTGVNLVLFFLFIAEPIDQYTDKYIICNLCISTINHHIILLFG